MTQLLQTFNCDDRKNDEIRQNVELCLQILDAMTEITLCQQTIICGPRS